MTLIIYVLTASGLAYWSSPDPEWTRLIAIGFLFGILLLEVAVALHDRS